MELKKTALYDRHVSLGAKMVPFAGYMMPVQYSGILDEHRTVRNSVGVFDVSHMGEFEIRGADAVSFLNRMTTNNVARLEVGQVHYSSMLYDNGGIVDDLLVYRCENHLMAVVNAANITKDFKWLEQHIEGDVRIDDVSDCVTLMAVQGPDAAKLVVAIAEDTVQDISYYHFREGNVAGVPAMISRTGYTGEDGFELYVSRDYSEQLWDALFETGKQYGIKPVGLGARDSLRLEVCFLLYGNDMDQTTNPVEAGLGWIVKSKKKGGFIGKEPVIEARTRPKRKLVGFVLKEKGIARQHAVVYRNGARVGEVTSGGYSPMRDQVVGLAYLDLPHDATGTPIEIDIRGRRCRAEVVDTPFYNRS